MGRLARRRVPPPARRGPDFATLRRIDDVCSPPRRANDRRCPSTVVADTDLVNWSEDLEALHEETSRDHFIDVWTRRALAGRRLGPSARRCVHRRPGLLDRLSARGPAPALAGGRGWRASTSSPPGCARRTTWCPTPSCCSPTVRAAVRGRERRRRRLGQPARARARRRGRAARGARVLKPGARASSSSPPARASTTTTTASSGTSAATRAASSPARRARRPRGARRRPPRRRCSTRRSGRSRSATAALTPERATRSRSASRATSEQPRARAWARSRARAERGLLRRGVRLPFGIRGYTVAQPGP